MKTGILLAGSAILFTTLSALALGGCGNDGESGNGKKSSGGMTGTWYEQSADGGILTVTEDEFTYSYNDHSVSCTYSTKRNKEGLEIIPDDEDWWYPDIQYYKKEDKITMHTMPHTDGDGGYHLMTFLRTEYVAPPPVTYGERIDKSDASAPKSFSEHGVQELSLAVCEPSRVYGDMAPEEPREGSYAYRISRKEDGGGIIDYEPCPERVELSAEEMEELAELLADSRLDSLNGVDIWTEDTPEDTTRYELNITFTDGASYHSRANWKDVSDVWLEDGYVLHQFIYEKLTAAGYSYWDNSFHSTKPMLRLGPEEDAKPDYRILTEDKPQEKKGTAYDYTVSTQYTVFTAEGMVPKALMDTLEDFSERYRKISEQTLAEDDALMAAVPKKTWQKEDRCSARSLYVSDQENLNEMFYSFYFNTGRANSFGLPPAGYGLYIDFHVYIDVNNGKILSAADLFTDASEIKKQLKERVESWYKDPKYGIDFNSFEADFEKAFNTPACDGGVDIRIEDDCVNLSWWKPEDEDHEKVWCNMEFYYDELQSVLNPDYAVMR
ncbi:MAG: hypothetical protein IK115_12765 [Lachnospiraceae bacterium]|nr:hypothetical protein [Lachnospiraceae bacterium]